MKEDLGADSTPSDSRCDDAAASAKSADVIHSSWRNVPQYTFNYAMGSAQSAGPWHPAGRGPEATFPHTAASIQKEPGAELTIAPMSSPKSFDIRLTRRQRDVLNLIVQGMSNKEIARSLKLAEGTVKIHIAALFAKLGVHRRAAVAAAGSRFFSSLEQAIS